MCCAVTPRGLGFGSGNLTEGTRTKLIIYVGKFGGGMSDLFNDAVSK